MVDFIESYDCTIDNKGRIIVPVSLKRQLLPFADKKFVVKRSVHETCLELYVMDEWNKLRMKVSNLNPFKKKHAEFIRNFFAGVKEVEMDSTGRILIAKDLLAYSGISKDVTIASVGKKIEIWDKASYESKIADTGTTFGELAEEVMGEIDFSQD